MRSDTLRNERLNVGLAVFGLDELIIHIGRRLDKVRAVSAAVDIDRLRSSVESLPEIDSYAREEGHETASARADRICQLTPFAFTAFGSFEAINQSEYEYRISQIMQSLVEPEASRGQRNKGKSSKVLTDLKKTLRMKGVLALKDEGLESHRVVPNMKLAEGLLADLVLKNGAMHIIETVDAINPETSLRKVVTDIAMSNFLFEQAKILFDGAETKPKLVYQAASHLESLASDALSLAERNGAELVNWHSMSDRIKLVSYISALATPVERAAKVADDVYVQTSKQARFNLN
ncbi:hypothetical protein [Sandaracinobacter sp.]|uniref:hypothetical protein n=1 Tax=Sandaracinobacter sp. TaxID=2487581 RepID=UPI0035B146DC